jgi:hypothetical protein
MIKASDYYYQELFGLFTCYSHSWLKLAGFNHGLGWNSGLILNDIWRRLD